MLMVRPHGSLMAYTAQKNDLIILMKMWDAFLVVQNYLTWRDQRALGATSHQVVLDKVVEGNALVAKLRQELLEELNIVVYWSYQLDSRGRYIGSDVEFGGRIFSYRRSHNGLEYYIGNLEWASFNKYECAM